MFSAQDGLQKADLGVVQKNEVPAVLNLVSDSAFFFYFILFFFRLPFLSTFE